MAASDGGLDETVEELLASGIPSGGLSDGAHTFHLRVRNLEGGWSPVFTTVEMVEGGSGGAPARRLVQAEYFWNTDPGEGNGTPVAASDGGLDETVEELLASGIPSGGLSDGAHTFNLRVRDLEGCWSPVFTTVVMVEGGSGGAPPRRLVEAEYFWNTDPGEGNGTPVAASDGGLDETVEELLASGIPSGGLSDGAHTFNLRVRDLEGGWSPLFTTVVMVEGGSGGAPARRLVEAEYFWNSDPGEGNGTPLMASDGGLDETVEELLASGVPTFGLLNGAHTFHLRVRDLEGGWSPLFTTVVMVEGGGGGAPPRRLVEAEYFWNSDPGEGNGTPLVASDGAFDATVEQVLGAGLPSSDAFGPQTFNVRVRSQQGPWGPVFTTVVHHAIDDGSGTADFSGDPDGDRLDNLTEYFLGTRPLVPDLQGDYLIVEQGIHGPLGPEPRLYLEVRRNHVAPDVTVEALYSENLVDWFNEASGELIMVLDSPEQLRFYATDAIDAGGNQFFRLHLQWIAGP